MSAAGEGHLDFSRFAVKPEGQRDRRPRREPQAPLGKLFDRMPPNSPEAEMSLLGSLLLDPRVIADVLAVVSSPDDFYRENHGRIFKAIVEVYDKHHAADLVEITQSLRDLGVLDLVGGPDYLVELANSVPSSANAAHYARLVAEKGKLRRLIDAAGRILYEAYHAGELGPEGAREVLDAAETAVFNIVQEQEAAEPQKLADLLQQEIDRLEASEGLGFTGLPTGFPDLDDLLRGLQPGEVTVIAARPSMGKTALALNLAEQIALGGRPGAPPGHESPVGFFSLEMSKSAVTQRLLSARSGVSAHDLRSGHRLDAVFKDLMVACDELKRAPLFIDDTPSMTALTLRARARRLVAQKGVKAIMVDYLQLMTAPGSARESRQVEVSAISRGIKALARELNVPVVCLSQLNRASEQREGNRPRMSDLRESGSIEQDADVIMLLHREEYYHTGEPAWDPTHEHFDEENRAKIGLAELIVAKQRNGPTGVVRLTWDSKTTRFRSHAGRVIVPPEFDRSPGFGSRDSGVGIREAGASGVSSLGGTGVPPVRQPFPHGKKTGPPESFRDGGGPDADEDLGGLPV